MTWTRDDIDAAIDGDAGLTALRALVDEGDDASHGLGHLVRVAVWTLRIGGTGIDVREAIAAALLHDLVNVPKNHPDRARASELSADAARPHLREAGFDDGAVERIGDAIRDHSFSRGAVPRGPLGRALQDADRLEALGAIGLARCFATGERLGGAFFHETDPFARDRPLDDKAYSVDHFYVKLLTLPATMCTEAGRAEAERRAERIRQFARDLADELGVAPPE